MNISVMFLKLGSSKLACQAAESGQPTASDNVVPVILGWQRMAEPEKLPITTVFQQTLEMQFLSKLKKILS